MAKCINRCIDWSDDWMFTKNRKTWESISLPHTCNMADGMSEKLFRGITCYQKGLAFSEQNNNKKFSLLFRAAGQKSRVYVNDTLVMNYEGGYTPFVVPLENLIFPGYNVIKVLCNNRPDPALIPMSADFNFNNGLHEKVYLYEVDQLFFDIQDYGHDRFHVQTKQISEKEALITLKSNIQNASSQSVSCVVHYAVYENKTIVAEGIHDLNTTSGSNAFEKDLTIINPHLWQGLDDPFLYTVELKLYENDTLIDCISTKIGLRYFAMDHKEGFFLNGKPYPLRGVAMHQDAPEVMSAMRPEDFDRDYDIIKDLGCTFLRLAHYPHDDYAYRKCDELGLIVQTEIPWVNHIGPNAGSKYYNCIKTNLHSMIINYYNHSSIIFWGICNELNGSHWKEGKDPQGGFSSELGIKWVNEFYDYAKTLDDSRYIGFTSHDDTFIGSKTTDWKADFIASNQYKGWYGGEFPQFGAKMDQYSKENPTQFWAVGEYGAGNNPFQHSLEPMRTTQTGTGGTRHDEEFANLFHESYLEQIQARPWLIYTSVWILFDFAVASRYEGETPYQNDKGLVTRDRQIKKDAYYLYQAAWSKEPIVHITGKRFSYQGMKTATIKVYSNAETLQLYQNNTLLATLNSPDTAGVVWNFDEIPLKNTDLRVIGKFTNRQLLEDTLFIPYQ